MTTKSKVADLIDRAMLWGAKNSILKKRIEDIPNLPTETLGSELVFLKNRGSLVEQRWRDGTGSEIEEALKLELIERGVFQHQPQLVSQNSDFKTIKNNDSGMVVIGLFSLISALGMFIYNVYLWLKTGVWFPVESVFLLNDPETMEWYKNPTTWLGLHKVAKIALHLPWGSFILLIITEIYFRNCDRNSSD